MSMEKCSVCGNEYDTGINAECPVCAKAANAEEIEAFDEIKADEAVVSDEEIAEVVTDCETEDCENSEETNEEDETSCKNTKNILNIIIAVLVLLVLAAIGRIVYLNMPYNAKNTINVKSFGIEDVAGTYNMSHGGQYFKFTVESSEVTIEPSVDLSALSDAEILSDAEAVLPETEKEVKTFDGTFETAYIKDEIKDYAMYSFIANSGYGEEYVRFLISRRPEGRAYEMFLKEYDHEEEYDEYEKSQNIISAVENYKMNGYWSLEDGKLALYNDGGAHIVSCEVSKNGITLSGADFKGKVKKSLFGENTLTYASEDGSVKQTISTYKDGNLILTIESEGEAPYKELGSYCVVDGYMVISFSGSLDYFKLTDTGMTQQLLNK